MIGIINYGMGNLGSVRKKLDLIGTKSMILDSPKEISSCPNKRKTNTWNLFGDAAHG
jgi:imidazoleglycerol phosphate synthase glutamine amidotransferase subunit HisH